MHNFISCERFNLTLGVDQSLPYSDSRLDFHDILSFIKTLKGMFLSLLSYV